MEWKTHLSLFSKKKKYFSKEELISSDLEETAGTGGLPERKKSFPKEEPVTDPDESENKRVPEKKRKLSSKEEPLSSGPEEAAASKGSAQRRRRSPESCPRGGRMDTFLVGHDLQRCSPSHALEPNKNKSKFTRRKKNLPASSEDVGSIPGSGRSQMPWSNKARAPQLLSRCPGPVLRNGRVASACCSWREPSAAKNKADDLQNSQV